MAEAPLSFDEAALASIEQQLSTCFSDLAARVELRMKRRELLIRLGRIPATEKGELAYLNLKGQGEEQ